MQTNNADQALKTAAPVARRLSDGIYETLRLQIQNSTWCRGTRLPPEVALCRKFAVSRPVVREALARLKAAGWIETRRGSGSVVIYPLQEAEPIREQVQSVADLIHGFEFRFSVECDSARHAALRRSDAQMEAIEHAVAMMNGAALDEQAKGKADLQFHLIVAQASGNPFYFRVLSTLQEQILAVMRLNAAFHNTPHTRVAEIYRQHQRIVQAIRDQNGEEAYEAMAAHLRSARFGLLGFGAADI